MNDGEITKVSAKCAGRTVAAVEWDENDHHARLDVLRVRFTDGSALDVDVDYVERITFVGPLTHPDASQAADTVTAFGWRPIETAPKDGTLVDLWMAGPSNPGSRATDCWFKDGSWWKDYGRDGDLTPRDYVSDELTHWMRVAPPSSSLIVQPASDGEDREFFAFLAGFAASSEGYNGECQASDPSRSELPRALAEIRSNPTVMAELRRLFEASRVDPGSLRQP